MSSPSNQPAAASGLPRVTVIACVDEDSGLSRGHSIPWNNPLDRQHFRERTQNGILVMGSGTYKSMMAGDRSWAEIWGNRHPLLVSSTFHPPSIPFAYTLTEAVRWALEQVPEEGRVWICGGERLYREALQNNFVDSIELTVLNGRYACTSFFPSIPPRFFRETQRQPLGDAEIVTYERVHGATDLDRLSKVLALEYEGEMGYLKLVHECLLAPKSSADGARTGIPTRSLIGRSLHFDLHKGFPLLTTKDMRGSFEMIKEELKWFLEGDTDARHLRSKIWEGNTSEAFLRARGLPYEAGQAGPIYGHQWRRWGAGIEEEKGAGLDQIQRLVQNLLRDPLSRQHVVNAWNAADIDKMALPPCHFAFQVIGKRRKDSDHDIELSLVVYQRSADLGLGIPFNIASYSLLLFILCIKLMAVDPVDERQWFPAHLTIHMGDAHVYENHEEALWGQIARKPFRAPNLRTSQHMYQAVQRALLEPSFRLEDFGLADYESHGPVRMKMAV